MRTSLIPKAATAFERAELFLDAGQASMYHRSNVTLPALQIRPEACLPLQVGSNCTYVRL